MNIFGIPMRVFGAAAEKAKAIFGGGKIPNSVFGDKWVQGLEQYEDRSGLSGIELYKENPDGSMDIQFKTSNTLYNYPEGYTGSFNLEEMKRLAAQGYGLNRFINKNVKK
jgi:hypothetical protein